MQPALFRLLLLEDNEDDALLLQMELEAYAPGEFAVTRVERLAEALTLIRTECFDVILSDLGLPDSIGLATVQAIIAHAPALPLVVLTGMRDENLGRDAVRHGAHDYLVKGESGGALILREIRYAIEHKRLEVRLRVANEELDRRVHERTAELKIANSSLRESESRFRSLTELTSDGYWEQDEQFRFTVVGGARLGWFQEQGQQLIGKRRWEVDHINMTPADWATHIATLEAHKPFRDLELCRVEAGGNKVWVSTSGEPVFDDSRAFKGYRGTTRNITKHKEQEENLRRFRIAMDASADMVLFIDPVGVIHIDVNDAACRALGYSREELMAMGPWEVFSETREELCKSYDRLIKGDLSEATVEGWCRRKDGSRFQVESSRRAVNFETGDVIVAVARDITERKQAEQELVESEERFRGLVDQSIAGICIIQDGKFTYGNRHFAEIFGYDSANEMIGMDQLSLVHEKDRGISAEYTRRRLEGEIASISYEFTGLRKDGSTIKVGAHGTRATYRGRPAIIGLLQDISEKKRAEEDIRRYVAQLETAFMSTVEVATIISEMRDPYTSGHERRVAEIAIAIGAELGFDVARQEGLRVAGYLHDVGKITVPTEILAKPGRLTAIEFQLIQGHAQAGYDVLKGVAFPWPVAQIALQHHERMDGSGYPLGLKGDAILLEARIMAVADVVEAMSSHRPYRPGLGIEKALAEIERNSGTAYDAGAADACLRLFREGRYQLPA